MGQFWIEINSTDHKVATVTVELVQPSVIDIRAVHHLDGTEFGQQCIENVYVIELGFDNFDERRDVTLQIQQRMHLDSGLYLAKKAPTETVIDTDRRPRNPVRRQFHEDSARCLRNCKEDEPCRSGARRSRHKCDSRGFRWL